MAATTPDIVSDRAFRWEPEMAGPVHEAIDERPRQCSCHEVVDEAQAGQGTVGLLVIGFDQEAGALREAAGAAVGLAAPVARSRSCRLPCDRA